MSEAIEGTFVLEGLVEGRLPEGGNIDESLRVWVKKANQEGILFDLDLSGFYLSLLPLNNGSQSASLNAMPHEVIVQLLEELLELFPIEYAPQLFSTLNSREFLPSQERQSLYAIKPDGTIDVQQRTIDVQTSLPPRPLHKRIRPRVIVLGLLVATAIIGVASVFIDFRELLNGMKHRVNPVSVKQVKINAGEFERFLEVSNPIPVLDTHGYHLPMTLTRKDYYPVDDESVAQAMEWAGDNLKRRLHVEALVRGRLRLEFFNGKNDFIHSAELRTAGLEQNEKAEVIIVWPSKTGAVRIALRP
jgi:hypothetical protein